MTQLWALVTGATGAVGGEAARALVAAGYGVVLHGRRAEAVAAAAEELRAAGGTIRTAVVDLADPDAVTAALGGLRDDGVAPLVVVNAAAEFGPLAPVVEIDPAEWARVVALNLGGVMSLLHATVPAMTAAGWGRVIQVSSAAAVVPAGTGNAAYSVTKAAADRLLAHLAAELVGTGVTVHALHPGEIASRMWEHIREASTGREGLSGYADWARDTGEHPDDLGRVGAMITLLLDDAEASARNGRFSWAQHPEQPTLPLGVIAAAAP